MSNQIFLQKMSIKQKIISLTVTVALLIMMTGLFFTAYNLRNSLIHENEDKVAQITEMISTMIDSYKDEVNNGMPLAEAQNAALAKIRSIKYDDTNYVWVNTYSGEMIAHPTLKGNTIDLEDKSGKRFIADGINEAIKNGTAFIDYKWTKQGQPESKLFPKLSCFRAYPAWNWVIATGIYVDDINQKVIDTFIQILCVNILVVILVIIVTSLTHLRNLIQHHKS